jgi:hypothetical protein
MTKGATATRIDPFRLENGRGWSSIDGLDMRGRLAHASGIVG